MTKNAPRVPVLIAAVALAGLPPAPALAGNKPKPIDIAFDHFEKAQAYARIGQRREAIAEFEEAYRWSSQGDMLYNIGVLYRELAEGAPGNKPTDAQQAIEYFQRYLGAAPRTRERAKVERWIAELEQRRDGKVPAARTPEPPPATPPPPTPAAAPPPRVPAPAAPTVIRAAPAEVSAPPLPRRTEAAAPVLTMRAADPPVTTQVVQSPPAPATARLWWAVPVEGGIGAGMIVGAVVAGLGGWALYQAEHDSCAPIPPATRCAHVSDRQTVAGGLLGAGGVVLVGSAIGVILVDRLARRPADSRVALTPLVSPRQAALSLDVAW